MFYSIYEISVMSKGHSEEIIRDCRNCLIKTTKKKHKIKKNLLFVLLIAKLHKINS